MPELENKANDYGLPQEVFDKLEEAAQLDRERRDAANLDRVVESYRETQYYRTARETAPILLAIAQSKKP